MNNSIIQLRAIERFRPDPDRLYDVDMTALLAGVPRRSVLIYCRWGVVRPATSPEEQGWYFSSDAIGAIRRAEYLRANRGVNLPGLRVIFELVEELSENKKTNSPTAIAPRSLGAARNDRRPASLRAK